MNIVDLTVEDLLDPIFDCTTSVDELDFTPDQLKAAADAWCWLLALPATDEAARDEAMSDAPILVALLALPLARPAAIPADFMSWWQATEWEHFPRSDGPQGEAWAWGVGLRACELQRLAGPLRAAEFSAADLVKRFAGRGAV